MPGQFAPQGELEALHITKEVTFGSLPGSPTWIGHCFRTLGGKTTIDDVDRAPRASLMAPLPGTGGRTWGGSFDPECTEDTFPQLLAYCLGGQSAPSTNLYSSTTTSTLATGATTVPVASSLFVYAGETIVIDTGGSADTVTVVGINGVNSLKTTALAHNHSNNTAVAASGGPNCKLILMQPATPLPSFSLELVRIPTGNPGGPMATDYLGACIDQMTLSCAMKQGLTAKISLLAQNDVTNLSPSSVSLSSLNPYIYEQQNTFAQIGGEVTSFGTAATLLSWTLTINNNLNKQNYGYGYGNLVRSFPEQQRKVSGQMSLLFESQAQLTNFNAAQFGGNLPPISALIPLVGTDQTGGAGNPYAIGLWLPKLKLRTLDFGDDTSKAITQTYAFSAGESVPGANDTIEAYVITAASAIY